MTWRQVVPMSFTMSAMLAGFFSLMMSAAGQYAEAAQLIMLSMVLDGLDGTLARLLKGTTAIGAEMDTFVDMTSFGLAPAFLAYYVALKHFGLFGVLIAGAIVLSGVTRLSRFRVVDPERGQKGFLGLPITVNGGFIAMVVFFMETTPVDAEWLDLVHGPLAAFIWGTTLAFTVLQVSHVRYTKPTKNPLFFVACLLMVSLIFITKMHLASAAALTICAYGFVYAFISPFFRKKDVLAMGEDDDDEDEIEEHISLD